jgi:aryl-alcohol dehydrogenase-like predicted oxidoreductase
VCVPVRATVGVNGRVPVRYRDDNNTAGRTTTRASRCAASASLAFIESTSAVRAEAVAVTECRGCLTALPTNMDFNRLGNSGLVVSRLGLGCNNFAWNRLSKADSIPVLRGAVEAGVTLFDTSDSYGDSEVAVGEALEGRRDEVVIATKFGSDLKGALGPDWGARGSRRYIRKAVERSLGRLRTDHIDLYQLHRPDPLTPIQETLTALTELVQEGKIRYIGSSNLAGWQVADAEWTARTHHLERFVSAQNNYNLLEREIEADVVPACEEFGIGILPYFPLASGLLTGKYTRGEPAPKGTRYGEWGLQAGDERFDVVEKLQAFAAERGVEVLDVAMGGLAAQPAVSSVIAGATSVEQIRRNAEAVAWQPTADDLRALDQLAPTPRS